MKTPKKIFILFMVMMAALPGFANQIKAIKNNVWSDNSTWDLNRIPMNGDTVIIPFGWTVTVDKDYSLNNITLLTYGVTKMDKGKLNLNNASRAIVGSKGLITGQNANDQILLGGVLKFTGFQGIQSGPSFAEASTGSAPLNGFVYGFLPVKFLSFFAEKQQNSVQLSWSTADEINNQYFDVEKSTDGQTWVSIGKIKGEASASLIHKYIFTENNPMQATIYYRIRQVDFDGHGSYSVVKRIQTGSNLPATNIYASSKNSVSVDFNREVKGNVVVKLISLNGQVIAHREFNNPSYRVSLEVQNANGLVLVQVTSGDGWNEMKKVVF